MEETNKLDSRDLLMLYDLLVDFNPSPTESPKSVDIKKTSSSADAPILSEIVDSIFGTDSPSKDVSSSSQSPTKRPSDPTFITEETESISFSGSFTEIPTKKPAAAGVLVPSTSFPSIQAAEPTKLEQTTESTSFSGSSTSHPTIKPISEPAPTVTDEKPSSTSIMDLIMATDSPTKLLGPEKATIPRSQSVSISGSSSSTLPPGMLPLEPTKSPYPTLISSESSSFALSGSDSQSYTISPNSTLTSTYSYSYTMPPYPTRIPFVIDKLTETAPNEMNQSTYIIVGATLGIFCLLFITVLIKSNGLRS